MSARFRVRVPLGWRSAVLLGLAGVGYATGQVLAPSALVVGVAAHAVVARLTGPGRRTGADAPVPPRHDEQEIQVEKAILLVRSNPVPGHEDEYNRWYDGEHVPQMLSVPGFVRAQRYVVHGTPDAPPEFRYLAIYEIEGPVADALAALAAAKLSVSASLDERVSVVPYVSYGGST